MTKSKCNKCKKNFRVLTTEDICYFCHINKYGVAPTQKQYGNPNVKGDKK